MVLKGGSDDFFQTDFKETKHTGNKRLRLVLILLVLGLLVALTVLILSNLIPQTKEHVPAPIIPPTSDLTPLNDEEVHTARGSLPTVPFVPNTVDTNQNISEEGQSSGAQQQETMPTEVVEAAPPIDESVPDQSQTQPVIDASIQNPAPPIQPQAGSRNTNSITFGETQTADISELAIGTDIDVTGTILAVDPHSGVLRTRINYQVYQVITDTNTTVSLDGELISTQSVAVDDIINITGTNYESEKVIAAHAIDIIGEEITYEN